MAEQIQELIEKIQREGIQQAEQKARQIEEEAKKRAQEIIRKAEQDVQKALEEARQAIERKENTSRANLKQASRDMLLSLKAEIYALLDKIIKREVAQLLNSSELANILSVVIRDYISRYPASSDDIVVTLNPSDLKKLENHFLEQLKQEIKKGIEIRPAEHIRSGFTISFDSGKSQFEFTDAALTEYLSRIIKPQLAQLLKET
ncbi:MAG: V-type ATP synthase subunit E family protein [Candidatus Omnitrophica bacterium]|nr:V-type ATP synthase subunit E family protein [Candidatus Omnitrophota bacterium]